MGIRAGLTEITPDLFEQVGRGGEPDLTGGEHYSIDKAWRDFHVVFARQSPPLKVAITGDYLHPQSPHTLDEFCKGNHEWYLGFVSPHLVREIAELLSGLSLSQLKEWYDEMGVGQYDCGFSFFGELKKAYIEAAKRGNALMILVA